MTPNDVAAWRFDIDCGTLTKPGALALCDALEQAWAETAKAHCRGFRDGQSQNVAAIQSWADHESDRADRAEAEVALLRCPGYVGEVVGIHRCGACGEHHTPDLEPYLENAYAEHARLRAALARVRALCDVDYEDSPVRVWEIRAAIEGTDQ